MKALGHVEAMRATLIREMRADEKIILLSAGATELGQSLIREFGSDRIRGTALDSPAIAGAALGAAQAGLRPVVELQTTAALTNAAPLLERIPKTASSIVFWLRPSTDAIFAADGWLAATSPAVVAFPATPAEAFGYMAAALHHQGGAVLLLDHPALAGMAQAAPQEPKVFGEATIKRAGSDLTLVSCGPAVSAGLAAAEHLDKNGQISVEIVALGTLRPLDTTSVLRSLRKTGRLLLAAPAFAANELAQIVKAINEQGFDDLDAPIRQIDELDEATLAAALSRLASE